MPLQNQPIENQVNIVTTLVTRVPSRLSLSLVVIKRCFPDQLNILFSDYSVISQVIRHIKFPCLICRQFRTKIPIFILKKIEAEISQKNDTLLKISAKNLFTKLMTEIT